MENFLIILGLIILIIYICFIYKYLHSEKEKYLNIIKILNNIFFIALIGLIIQLIQLKQNEYKNRTELIQIFYKTLMSNDNDKIKKSLILIHAIDPVLYRNIDKNIESLQYKNSNSMKGLINTIHQLLLTKKATNVGLYSSDINFSKSLKKVDKEKINNIIK